MDQSSVEKVSRKVKKQFPEMKGISPAVRKSSESRGRVKYELTYKGKVELPGGRKLRRVVRVVADEKGKIIRMSTSK